MRGRKRVTLDRRELQTLIGRELKSDAQSDLENFVSEYPATKGWKEQLSRREVQKYPDGKWYGKTVVYREVNDQL